MALTTCALCVPHAAHAQRTLEVGLLSGYLRATGEFEPASVYSTALPRTPSELSGLLLGATVRAWLGPRLGMQAQWTTARSESAVCICPGVGPIGPVSNAVRTVSWQGLLDVSSVRSRGRLWLGLGGAFVKHGGDGYGLNGGATTLGWQAGAGVEVPIASEFSGSFEASAIGYEHHMEMPPHLRRNPGPMQRGPRVDYRLSLGLLWSVE